MISLLNNYIGNIPSFVSDAFVDSIKLLPALFIIFVFIEIFENYFSRKIAKIVSFSRKLGPVLGGLLAIIPQCGFSVVMTTLFVKNYITLGTLISVYIATSDESIPILLTYPSQYHIILKIILIKLAWAILVGYIVDFLLKTHLHECKDSHAPCEHLQKFHPDKGCCAHEIDEHKISNIIIHPIKHTLVIFSFILLVCIGLNYIFTFLQNSSVYNFLAHNTVLQIVFFAFFGLVPNCAVSVIITMLYLKGGITFAAVISGLTSNAGLGLLVLFAKKENLKKFFIITGTLLITAVIAGLFATIPF